MVSYLLLAMILLPMLLAAVVLAVTDRRFRNVCVLMVSGILMVSALLIIKTGAAFVEIHGTLAEVLDYVIFAADVAISLIALYFGFKFRSIVLAVLSIAQLIPLVLFHIQINFAGVEKAFHIDHLSMIMLLLVNIIGPLIAVYALHYMQEHEHHQHLTASRQHYFFATILLFLGAMNGLVMANNINWIHFFWEVTTLCSFLLIGHDQTEAALANAKRALIINFFGGVAFILGIMFIYSRVHTIAVHEILTYSDVSVLLIPMALLVLAGFTKSAQIPFQSWLLGAMVAPTPVSALLHSSTMVKAGIYLIFRFAPVFLGTWLADMSALIGAFTFAAAALLAISQTNAKRILAYSTISNLGLMITLICILDIYAIYAAALLIVLHGVSKALLFLCVGTIEQAIGSRDLEDMDGIRQRLPLTAFLATFGAISMLLPPFGVLITKWIGIEVTASLPPVMFLIILGSACTVFFWAKFIGKLLSHNPEAEKIETLFLTYQGPLAIIAVLALITSIFMIEFSNMFIAPFISSAYLGSSDQTIPNVLISDFAGFYPPAFFAVTAIALLLVFILYNWLKPKRYVQPFLSGENSGHNQFYSLSDGKFNAGFRNYYFSSVLNEHKLTYLMNSIASALLIVLFGVILR